ncbi:MAG: hypothetical protein K1X72_27905 [Pyrinomonadaceae bacterium]|nr:hypothetical protein [Pyrinomonadaceae bacterium]
MKKWSVVSGRWSAVSYKASVFICVHLWLVISVFSQNKPCQLDEKTMQFVGSPVAQARCLLRPNKIGGVLGEELKKMPDPLEKLIGEKVKIKKENLRKYLQKNKIDEQNVGGSLDEILSKAKLPNGEEIQALYFLIHDTSSPYLQDADDFPADINETSYKGNKLEIWLNNPVAHIFVNRVGESITTTPFAESVRKGWGTKFARDILKADAKGLQIHIELIQPRRRDKTNPNPNNDLIAPAVGFTEGQYERLALLYVCASVRRGTWLIPSYHSAMDAGIKDAHDDPQNFDLKKFAKELKKIINSIKTL